MFLILSRYILEKKTLLANKYKTQMCYNKNKFLFFDVTENVQIFPSEVCHIEHHHRFLFLVKKCETLEVTSR